MPPDAMHSAEAIERRIMAINDLVPVEYLTAAEINVRIWRAIAVVQAIAIVVIAVVMAVP